MDWVRGDSFGLELPVHIDSLRAGAETFLTRAFRAAGSLADDNRVTRITGLEEISGGSTGRKALLSVEYEKPFPGLHTELFVKFSRALDDEMRDQARVQMELEASFALLSRSPAFPIRVPVCYFSDYQQESGTGILITQRIAYDSAGIEPHYPKCLDHRMPDPAGHYRAIVRALARLAGTHKGGRLPDIVESKFPFDLGKLVVSQRVPYTPEQISSRVEGYADFAAQCPQLLPENIRSRAFLARLAMEAPRFQALAEVAGKILQSRPELIALCHWNAHVDNAWFWRNEDQQLECGLLDWANVSQMNLAMAVWGCLSGAETDIWDDHLDELLDLFMREFESCGGPTLDITELKEHLALYTGRMGLDWILDVPHRLARIPGLREVRDRRDPRIESNERARAQLTILIAFLNLWEKTDMASVIARLDGAEATTSSSVPSGSCATRADSGSRGP